MYKYLKNIVIGTTNIKSLTKRLNKNISQVIYLIIFNVKKKENLIYLLDNFYNIKISFIK